MRYWNTRTGFYNSLSLIETYCLPILTYAALAVSLKVRQLQELNSCWNSAYRRVFGFHRWESVRSYLCGLGRLDMKHVIMLRKCRWVYTIRSSQNSLMLNLFWLDVMDSKNVFLLTALLWEVTQMQLSVLHRYFRTVVQSDECVFVDLM